MSKINSPSSNNSGTSSETSETQSVEDTNQSISSTASIVNSNSRSVKSWKRMKDNDKDADNKRPPWRAVSVSTLPKPDKSALLRAKLLDASRRLRAGKSSVAIQTDIEPTKLMKEVNLGTQPDLILYKEIGILTDGCYLKKKDGMDEFILTYSVSQLTDAVLVTDVATQTLLPKLPDDDFMEAYFSNNKSAAINLNKFNETQRKLLEQVQKIRSISKSQSVHDIFGETTANDNSVASNGSQSEETDTDTAATVQSYEYNQKPADKSTSATMLNTHARPSLLKPTLSSWHFEYDEVLGNVNTNFEPYIMYPSSSWHNFTTLSYPFMQKYYMFGNQRIDLNLLLCAIDELIQESHRLVDTIEELKAKQSSPAASNTFENFTSMFKQEKLVQPSEYWLPIIEQQERELNNMLKNLKKPKIRNLQKFDIYN